MSTKIVFHVFVRAFAVQAFSLSIKSSRESSLPTVLSSLVAPSCGRDLLRLDSNLSPSRNRVIGSEAATRTGHETPTGESQNHRFELHWLA